MLRNRIGAFFPFLIHKLTLLIKRIATNVCFSKMIAKDSWSASAIAVATEIVAMVTSASPTRLATMSAEDSNFSSRTDKLEDRELNFVRQTSSKLEKRRIEVRV